LKVKREASKALAPSAPVTARARSREDQRMFEEEWEVVMQRELITWVKDSHRVMG
jgi:hypothetical protein